MEKKWGDTPSATLKFGDVTHQCPIDRGGSPKPDGQKFVTVYRTCLPHVKVRFNAINQLEINIIYLTISIYLILMYQLMIR